VGDFCGQGEQTHRQPLKCSKANSGWVRHAKILSMPTEHILALLIAERDKLNKAIEALSGPTKRLGRPPKNPLTAAAPAPKKKRRNFSAAQREAAAERMRQRWAAKRKAEAKATKKAVSKPKKTAKAA
jgi:hypothetical protein